jgi:hypothetical protein
MAAGPVGKFASAAAAGEAGSVAVNYRSEIAPAPFRQQPNAHGLIANDLRLLILFLIVDASIMVAYLVSHKFLSNALIFDVDQDFAVPSLYQFALLAGSALCIWRISKREAVYRPWAYLLAFLFIDDVVSVHETVGKFLGRHIIHPNILFFTKRSLGESIFITILAAVFIFSIVGSYLRATAFDRRVFKILTMTLAILAIFGLLFDIAHDYYRKIDENIAFWMGFLEEVGEIFTSSLLFWLCYGIYQCYGFGYRSPATVASSAAKVGAFDR